MTAELLRLAERCEKLTGPDRAIINRLDRTGDCWLWTGALDKAGRGRVWRNGKLMLHHRAVWEILSGPIPAGSILCHHCDNPQCANPCHIYIGTGKTNSADMFSRGRHWTQREPERAATIGRENGLSNTWTGGVANPKAKLTPEQVLSIKADKRPTKFLALEYQVDRTTVQRIRAGKLWPAAALKARALASRDDERGE